MDKRGDDKSPTTKLDNGAYSALHNTQQICILENYENSSRQSQSMTWCITYSQREVGGAWLSIKDLQAKSSKCRIKLGEGVLKRPNWSLSYLMTKLYMWQGEENTTHTAETSATPPANTPTRPFFSPSLLLQELQQHSRLHVLFILNWLHQNYHCLTSHHIPRRCAMQFLRPMMQYL